MNVPPTLHPVAAASASRAVGPLRAVGKANSSRDLDGECAGDDAFRSTPHSDRRRTAQSHNGTTEYAPLWNGPRLRPAFVAQVLGQAMTEDRVCALSLAPAAYRQSGAQIPPGALFQGDI